MKTTLMIILAATFAASAASAATAPCLSPCGCDEDGDGACTADMTRLDAAGAPGLLVGAEDCAPTDPTVHPGAVEILGDGIDQDCDGADLVGPLFAKNFCGSSPSARCVSELLDDIATCNADATKCRVVESAGRFEALGGHKFVDRKCDGRREIVSQADYDAFLEKTRAAMQNPSWTPRPDGRCTSDQRSNIRKPGGSKKATGSGISSTKFKELDTKVTGLDTKVGEFGAKIDENTKQIGTTLDLLDGLDTALKTETMERKAADEELGGRITDVEGSVNRLATQTTAVTTIATEARDKANQAMQIRPSFEVAAMVAAYGQKPVSIDGAEARPGFGFMPNLKAKLGIETNNDTYRVAATIGLPVESGNPGLHWGVGLEALWDLAREHMLGVYGGYHYNESGGDITGSAAASRGGDIGPVYKAFLTSPDEIASLAFLASVRVGVEQLGTKVQDEDGFAKTVGVGPNLLGEVGLAVCF